jgi:hypothetical protein
MTARQPNITVAPLHLAPSSGTLLICCYHQLLSVMLQRVQVPPGAA